MIQFFLFFRLDFPNRQFVQRSPLIHPPPPFSNSQYREVNVYLNRAIKAFVKKTVCFPELLTRSDFVHFSPLLHASEKCHVALLILEARKQAEMIYGIRAIGMSN